MRLIFWLMVALAGTGDAQWRHFGQDSARDMLAAHNAVRSRVGVGPLTWSDVLARRAQEWAEHLVARKQFMHRPNSQYGENLFEIRGAAATPAEVVRYWDTEAANYDYAANRCRGVCGHYTQIVWAGSKEVGCAMARGGGREVWVCNYDPPGNWVGRRPY